MPLLRGILSGQHDGDLDVAALEMATIERPSLDPEPYLKLLDELAAGLSIRLHPQHDGAEFLRIASHYLFEELNFRGNEAEYYDPRNSCLDWVLDRRTGIPITLSLVFIEVARRLAEPVFGIGLPGHFIVQYNDGQYSTFADPFHAGKLLTEEDCRLLAREVGVDIAADPAMLQPVSNRYILVRMLNNLRSSYFRSKNFGKAIQALDLLVEAFPANAEYYKARGVARLQVQQLRAAKTDLEMYLKCAPEAEDKPEVARQLTSIHRWLGRLN
jgi:regulator of sirC expression with transglutaminase-like and TPR domain